MDSQQIPTGRLYGELAWLWPLMSPPEEYAEGATHWRDELDQALGPGRHSLLELGVGGGHHLSHLAARFEPVVAVDLSEPMLAHSARLNPSVEHLRGDMRAVRLGRRFDAVTIHDAISHMLTEEDLRATFATAAEHLAPGGVFIAAPDWFRETFHAPVVSHESRRRGEVEFTYFEYCHDPDPSDTEIETIMTYVIRSEGRVRIEHDRLLGGLFSRATWVALMEKAGFDVRTRAFRVGGYRFECALLMGRARRGGGC